MNPPNSIIQHRGMIQNRGMIQHRELLDDTSRSQSFPLPAPGSLKSLFPLSDSAKAAILVARDRLRARIEKGHGAPLAIVGPCSIHCETAALEYAERLATLQKRLGGRVQLIMRAYFEKPRTTVGWKGFLYDPDLDGSDDMARGLARARKLLVTLSEIGVPLATEILDPLTAPYLEDCLSWVAIGARTSESQIHRQLASQLPCPVGFKNGTDGSLEAAACAIESAAARHSHMGIDEHGQIAMIRSRGNTACHVVLRGGNLGPNFSATHVTRAAQMLREQGRPARVLIDCSHQNSGKDYRNQPAVAHAVMDQLDGGHADVMGLMLESHLHAGRQDVDAPRQYGLSVTDGCIDFSTTEHLLQKLAERGSRSNYTPSK